jgi:uncharacterized protein YbjT (DUF2867 family)
MASLLTLVMGARGSVGRHVLTELLDRRVPVRASARQPRPGQFPAEVDVVAADLTDPGSLGPAFDGVGQVFLYANHDGVPGVVEAARAAGVRTIVLLSSGSVVHPTSRGNAITRAHREVEEAFAAAPGLTVRPIRPLVLATNALGWAHHIKAGVPLPLYQPDAFTAPVHERDVAAVAVSALLDDSESDSDTGTGTGTGTGGMLTGPVRLRQREQVAAIAAATGRDIAIDELTRPAALAQYERFMPATQARAVVQFLDDAARGNSPATGTVARILGRPATAFEVWAADHAGDFTTAAASSA